MKLFLWIKQLLKRFGYDIRYYHPFYETVAVPLDIKTILDIGANTGQYTIEMLKHFPDTTVYAFEPLHDCFTKLEHIAKEHSNVHPLHYALGDTTIEQTIERSTFHPSSSLLRMTSLHKALYPKSAGSSQERIEVKRLDDIANTLLLTEPVLVKIDVQGFEDRVISGGSQTLSKASIIIVETAFFTLYEGQPHFNIVAEKLAALGFLYYGSYHTHYSKKTGRPLYEDSVFVSKASMRLFEKLEQSAL